MRLYDFEEVLAAAANFTKTCSSKSQNGESSETRAYMESSE
jgi:hypothetical protein